MSTRQGPVKTRGRDAMGYGLAFLHRLARLPVLDQFGLRKTTERAVFQATRTGFKTRGAVTRAFTPARKPTEPARLPAATSGGLFDLTPTDDQQMMVEVVRGFAAKQLRPAAAEANDTASAPKDLLEKTSELGLHHIGVPEALGGAGDERSAITNVLVAEELARGDMGLAVACLAPTAVSTALTLWGNEEQQATYLPAFVSDQVPTAALAVLEPRPMFDPFRLQTKARRTPEGFTLNGTKSLVPRAADAELFVIAAELEGGPSLFLVESSTAGLTIEAEPAMGVRAASMGRVVMDDLKLPGAALLATGDAYRECVDLSRLAWCALAVGTGQAVLDYVIPYVNQREAFGEPISHRQSVAFMVADIGTELDGMRLVTYRAASRAAQGKPFGRETALAHRLCAERGMVIGSHGVQLLGGHGFVKEHPVERWYRDLRAIGVTEGGVLV
ncbi:MAG TPA: acyl-CoA dehydrogenase family protein [Micromonosporaceae bacterium]